MPLKSLLISGRFLSEPLPDLDDHAIGRIVAATGYRGNHVPRTDVLRDALLSTLINYRRSQALDGAPSLSAARAMLKDAHKACRKLIVCLRQLEESATLFALVGRQVGRQHSDGRPPVYDLLREAIAGVRDLDRWIGGSVAATAPNHPHFEDGSWRDVPAAHSENWLLARSLPRVFSRHFRSPFTAAVARDSDEAASPGARFVIAACRELGLGEKSPSAVKKAWQRYHKAPRDIGA